MVRGDELGSMIDELVVGEELLAPRFVGVSEGGMTSPSVSAPFISKLGISEVPAEGFRAEPNIPVRVITTQTKPPTITENMKIPIKTKTFS